MFTIKKLTKADLPLVMNVADDVFDNSVNEKFSAEFLKDPRHHIVVALVENQIVGFASAVHYIHPDKPTELWINEVGVASQHHNKGIAKAILQELFEVGKSLGCSVAWVLTEDDNLPANKLYQSVGGEKSETVLYEFKL